MQISTILLIVLAAVIALGLVLFQYYYKAKKRGKLLVLLSFLRFIGLFGIFILLINPKFTKNEYTLEKANLVILTDNSSSVSAYKDEITSIIEKIKNNATVSEQFKLESYVFGTTLKNGDSLSFEEKNTNISKALITLKEVFTNTKTAVVLLTDGNQTLGKDYGYLGNQLNYTVYPIAVGDTTQYEDLRIGNVNSNKFTFLKNKFPLEIEVSYTGNGSISTTVKISINGENVYSENLALSNSNTIKTINTLLTADEIGVKDIEITVGTVENERNVQNNRKNIAIEVIDEKTNITIITDLMHPDIGALKKAIESNEQRSVHIKKSNVSLKELEDVDVFILYQPSSSFTPIYNFIQQRKTSVFTITGTKTNWNAVNRSLRNYRIEDGYPNQEVFGVVNPSFTKFDISDFSLADFPPLESDAGQLSIDGGEALLQMSILGRTQIKPLLFALDNENGKELFLFGEHIWKWRMQSYRNNQSFENFDDFIGKLLLYLASNDTKNRLNVDFQSVYEGSNEAKIKASYFDEAFMFNSNATLLLKLMNEDNGTQIEIPMLLKNNFYEADLTNLQPGKYTFSITVKDENRSYSGVFTILDFNVEQQFLTTNYKKLSQLANATGGELYFLNQTTDLVQRISQDDQYIPTQKSTKNIVSLIDFRLILAIIIATLAMEWFIRKYNGLT